VSIVATAETRRNSGPRPPQPNSAARVVGHTDFLGVYPEIPDGPQAFLVEVEGEIFPHFHTVDQFQVVIDGGCSIGKHRAEAVAIHYTDRYTPYGPITADDDETLSFYTLRAVGDNGSHRMPGSPKPVRSGRSFTVGSGLTPGEPTGTPGYESVIPDREDGLGAFVIRVAPGCSVDGPPPAGAGRYHIVVNGSCTVDGQDLGERSIVWSDADEQLQAVAGDEGAEFAVLQFPRRPIGH
jgi:hypothetical protein